GYISSADCLAIAPEADQLQKLTVLFDCGTPRVFEEASYKYVFRTGATSVTDNVAAAFYVANHMSDVSTIAGINQNYAWGQDSWSQFLASLKAIQPNIEVKAALFPKFMSGQLNAEITTLLSAS